MERIGILGGSFDPPHNAHLALARLFQEALSLDRLLVIPAGEPWQKHHLHTGNAERLDMLEMTFKNSGLPIETDRRELDRAGPSYTADTLTALRQEYGDAACLIFLMGADQLLGLPSWYAWPEILDLANFAVAGRPGTELDAARWPAELNEQIVGRMVAAPGPSKPAGQILLIPADLGAVSSSQVRELLRIGDNKILADLLPSAVLEYIRQRGLYLS